MQPHISIFYVVFLLTIICIGCKQVPNNQKKDQQNQAQLYEGIPKDVVTQLFNECDYVDHIFYNLPFSLSQDDPAAIKAGLQFLSIPQEPTDISICTTPLARISYQVKGEIIAEADIYFNETCRLFVFIEDNKPKYVNPLNQQGLAFYQNILSQFAK